MRLGVVTTSFPRFPGDPAGGFVADHVRWLRHQGHQVEVIAADDHQVIEQPRVTRVPSRAGLFYAGGAPEALAGGFQLAALHFSLRTGLAIAGRGWDAMIGHWLVPAAIAAIAAPRTPLIAIAHSGDVDLLCRLGLARPVLALLKARRARVVFVAAHLRERMRAHVSGTLGTWLDRCEVVAMGIDVEALRANPVPRLAGQVAFLGRLVEIKGVPVLLEALPGLCAGGEVVVAGDGPLADAVTKTTEACGARYLGEVRGRARDELLQSSEIVVLPSVEQGGRQEGAPVAAFEAMAAGAAVVASKTGGLAELPASSVTWVEPGSASELLAAVSALRADDSARRAQIESGARVAEGRDWSRVGPQLSPHQVAPGR